MTLTGSTPWGTGTVLDGTHRITQGLTTVEVGKNGFLTTPASATGLIADPLGNVMAAVMEQTTETGLGRVFAIGDFEMLADQDFMNYDTDAMLIGNIAAWALGPYIPLTGHVVADGYSTVLKGLLVQLDIYSGPTLVQTVTGLLDGNAGYEVALAQTGTFDVRAKPHSWLSAIHRGVTIGNRATLDWYFPYLGDATGDNRINLLDLSSILADFNLVGTYDADVNGDQWVNLLDLSLVLSNFGKAGE